MGGVITQKHWKSIERTFPGLHLFYAHLPRKPRTFLELLELYRVYRAFTTRRQHVENETRRQLGVETPADGVNPGA